MSVIDKVIAAVTPMESDEARIEARAKARAAARPGTWLALVLDHHLEIEGAFTAVRSAATAEERRTAQKRLGVLLTGHSIAEESVIYPALASAHEKGHAEMAYTEQSAAKVQMAALEAIDPMSHAYLDKLEHIRGAVAHHVYEEEHTRFIKLYEKMDPVDQRRLTQRYEEEFIRYCGEQSNAGRSFIPPAHSPITRTTAPSTLGR